MGCRVAGRDPQLELLVGRDRCAHTKYVFGRSPISCSSFRERVETVTVPLPCSCSFPAREVLWALRRPGFFTKPGGDPAFRWSGTSRAQGRSSFYPLEMVHSHSFHPWKVQETLHTSPVQVASMSDVVSTGGSLLQLGIGRAPQSRLDHAVRILHHLPLNIFRVSMLFTHAVVPSAFRLQVSAMIQEAPSPFFLTVSGILKPRHAAHTNRTLIAGVVSPPVGRSAGRSWRSGSLPCVWN